MSALPARGSGTAAAGTSPGRGWWSATWSAVTAFVATALGLAPHVLHHVGLLAGTAFVVGVGGNLLFGAVGLLLSVPLLRRLHRRFDTWKAPAAALVVFTVMFALSAFVVGPAISGNDQPVAPPPGQGVTPDEHAQHHR